MSATVDLYWSDPGDPESDLQVSQSLSWLRADERERHGKLVREVDRRLFLLGRFLLRTALAAKTGTDPASWSFPLADHGRPRPFHPDLAETPDANLSHTAGLAVVVVAEAPVGVDVERSDRRPPGRRPERFLTEAELDQWQSVPESDRVRTFWRLWTLKEAWLKALGTGVAGGLHSGSICLDQLVVDTAADRRMRLAERVVTTSEGAFQIGIAHRTPGEAPFALHESRTGYGPGS